MNYLFFYKYSQIHGGIPVIMRHLGHDLTASGRDTVSIMTEHTDYAGRHHVIEDGLHVYSLTWRNYLSFVFRRQVDVVCVFEPYLHYTLLVILLRLFKWRTRVYMDFCGTRTEYPSKYVRHFWFIIVRSFNRFIAVSEYTKRVAMNGRYLERINVVYNPVIIEKYKRSNYEKHNLLTIGRLCPRKNYEDLLAMFNIVHRADTRIRLDIIGSFESLHEKYYQKVITLIKEYQLEDAVTLHGDVPEPEKVKLLSTSRIYVTASKHEMFGITTAEAMASGLPIVAFANTATEEVVQIAQNILVPDGDYRQMAAEVLALINDQHRIRELGNRSLLGVKRFSLENFLAGYTRIFNPPTKL